MSEYGDYMRKSFERLSLSKIAYEDKFYESSVSLSYYAMFLATKALCASKGFDTKKHYGVLSFFSKEFINTNIFDKKFYNYISDAFRERKRSDYFSNTSLISEIEKRLDKIYKKVQESLSTGSYIGEYFLSKNMKLIPNITLAIIQ